MRLFIFALLLCFTVALVGNLNRVEAARIIDFTEQEERELSSESELIKRIQIMLNKMDYYSGPEDGRMSEDLRQSIRTYQKTLSKKIDGLVSDDLANHMETQSRVGAMLRRLNQIRKTDIAAARKALANRAETREFLKRGNIDEVADPTRDASPCFRDPKEKCLLEEAIESAKAIHKRELRDWALGEILVAQAKTGFIAQAINTVSKIGDARLIIVALRDIARAQARAGRIDDAWQAAQIIPSAFQRLEAFAAIADIQLKNKDHDGAHETAAQIILQTDRLDNPLQQVTLLAQMAVVLAKIGDTGAAEDALTRAQGLARSKAFEDQLSSMERGAALRHVASAFAEIGQPLRALSLIEEVSGAYDRTAVLMSAATAQAQSGDTKAALETARKIIGRRYSSVILGRIAVAMSAKGQKTQAAVTIRLALTKAEDIELDYARSYAIGQLSLSLIDIGIQDKAATIENAAETALEIENDRLRAYALWSVAAAQAKKGLTDEVKKTEQLAIDATDAIGSSLSQVWMLGDLATENIQAGQLERAASAFNRGIAIAESIDNAWGRARALAKLAATLHDFR
ncbi:MAG: peptidoglycan-binding protein [Rhodospirillaceae bacterium]|jgi:tetratricopeptide (TPR) repeat protein|nr:peptidoglycan-binding protein [Rhodospirillaceae bacterium]MBT7957519.1 peptidoglycan-binding protein [Rhodospirillaceae bacterium]